MSNNHEINNVSNMMIQTRFGRVPSRVDIRPFDTSFPGFNLFYSHCRPDLIKDQRNAGHIDRGNSNAATKSGNELPSYPESQRQNRLTSDGISVGFLKQATSSPSA